MTDSNIDERELVNRIGELERRVTELESIAERHDSDEMARTAPEQLYITNYYYYQYYYYPDSDGGGFEPWGYAYIHTHTHV